MVIFVGDGGQCGRFSSDRYQFSTDRNARDGGLSLAPYSILSVENSKWLSISRRGDVTKWHEVAAAACG
jgi:hypothetical protein